MNLQSITLISFGYFGEVVLTEVAEAVNHELGYPVLVKEGHLDISEYYDPVRRQYNGNKLLTEVDRVYSSDHIITIGLFNVDLFIPILTYIFGQAYLNGRTGIASSYRLSNERYGMSQNEKFILERFKKEILHEIGHTLGLIHCHIPDCVMRSSTYVEDIDQKGSSLCIKCRNSVTLVNADL
jgi:archaemetzincin